MNGITPIIQRKKRKYANYVCEKVNRSELIQKACKKEIISSLNGLK